MKRGATVAFVVIFSVLMITAVPANVSAASGQLVVGSQHTDFGTGNESAPQKLTNLSVEGSGDSASVVYRSQDTIESFESGGLSAYGGGKTNPNVQTGTVYNGTYALEITTSNFGGDIISDTGRTLQQGDRFSARVYVASGGGAGSVLFGTDAESSPNGYGIQLSDSGYIRVHTVDNGAFGSILAGKSTNVPTGEWVRVVVNWKTDGTITATLYDSAGTEVESLTTSDSTYTQGGIGWWGQGGSTYYDELATLGGSSATYLSANHSISNAEEAAINIVTLRDGSATLGAEYYDGTSWPVVDAASASPSGGETVQTQSPTLSINVTDREFGATQGDTVTATAYDASDDSQIGSTTLNANGTASVTWSDPLTGSNSYYWVVKDSYGESTTTQDFTFDVPGTLRVFNESAPNTKINDTVGLRVRFFATESGTVVERDVTNGTADLTGLPADQPIAITLKDETDGYVYRRITIDSIVEQQDIYLLPTQANSVQVVFELEDPTGQFAPEETRLLVEKPIKKDFDGDGSNETRYQIVSGDLFGSSGQYPAQLLQDERYRLRVLTEDGNERILGSYTAFGPATEPLQIEQIEPKADQDAGEALYGDVEVANGGNTTTATIRYQNLGDESTTVEYRILAGNQTVIGNVTSDADTFAHVYNVSSANATTFTVEYMIKKPTTTEYGQFKLGGIAGVAGRLSIDAQVLSIISWLLILSTMGLIVIVDPKLAPAGGTGMASGLVILGTVAIPAPVLGVAGAVSVLTLVGGGES